MSTMNNLQEAFSGESQANRRYLAFAKKADQDGFPQVAKLFRAAAEAETVHANAHLRVMGGIKSTAENLKIAIDGEGYEFKSMYPKFIEEAEAEGNKAAVATFKNAMPVERTHHDLYENALASVEAGNDLPQASIHICTICGHTVINDVPDRCPVCGAPKGRFIEIE